MSRKRRGDEHRFRALYAAHYDDVLRFVARRIEAGRAEDVVGDTFLVAWRRLDEVPSVEGEALPWLYAVARNCLLNSRRTDARHQALAVRIAQQYAANPRLAESAYDEDFLARRLDVSAAWGRLSPVDQEVLGLAIWEGLPSAQAALVLGISDSAYRVRLTRARRALRAHLAPTDTNHNNQEVSR